MTDLKSCPFCDGSSSITPLESKDDRRYWERTVACDYCNCSVSSSIPWGEYNRLGESAASQWVGEKVNKAWNTRTAPVVTDAMVEAAWFAFKHFPPGDWEELRTALTAALAQMEGKE